MSHSHIRGPGTNVLLWLCPVCTVDGPLDVDPQCPQCHGLGVTDDIAGFEADARPAPLPPGTPRQPCPDCAFRPDSPEDEFGGLSTLLDPQRPFVCHQGIPMIRGEYTPTVTVGGVPIGGKLCRGWIDYALTGERPTEPYRQMAEQDSLL